MLLLIKTDRQITGQEFDIMKRLGKALGFEEQFCETAINEILDNPYIDTAHPVFSSKDVAQQFIKDGLTLAIADKEVHTGEVEWLQATAQKNDIDLQWFKQEARSLRGSDNLDIKLFFNNLVTMI